jgi:hypothetical protein
VQDVDGQTSVNDISHLFQLLLMLMNPDQMNCQALFERLGVQGRALLLIDFDDMCEGVLLMDEGDLVVVLPAPGKQDKDVGSAALSDAGAEDNEQEVDSKAAY